MVVEVDGLGFWVARAKVAYMVGGCRGKVGGSGGMTVAAGGGGEAARAERGRIPAVRNKIWNRTAHDVQRCPNSSSAVQGRTCARAQSQTEVQRSLLRAAMPSGVNSGERKACMHAALYFICFIFF